jgi:kinesin family protein 2/24
MRETKQINISLSVLKDCIRAKAQADTARSLRGEQLGQKVPYIPFRQSALTRVLKHVFDQASTRPCRTIVLACVNPSLADVGATKNTLRFAELLRVLIPISDKSDAERKSAMHWTNTQLKEWIKENVSRPHMPYYCLEP